MSYFPTLKGVADELANDVLQPNFDVSNDHEIVNRWASLKGRPSKPFYPLPPRPASEFESVRQFLPDDFFEPFNRLLEIVGLDPINPQPVQENIDRWNDQSFISDLVVKLVDQLDSREPHELLIPYVVAAHLALEIREVPKSEEEWRDLDAVFVPGSRTFDRSAEAHRCYRRSGGNAVVVAAGSHPYYDPDQPAFYDVTEAEASAAYLRLLGVPANKIEVEIGNDGSKDTAENAAFLIDTLVASEPASEPFKILVATSPFHLARATLSVKLVAQSLGVKVDVYGVGSRASRYWPESYFLNDQKQSYSREDMMRTVLYEYTKSAYELCTQPPTPGDKSDAKRAC